VTQFYQEVYSFTPAKPIKIIIVRDEPGYVQALQREGYTQEQAVRTAKASGGVSLGAKQVIIIPADKNINYLSRIRTVTHEVFHQMQTELKGSASVHAWLVEGSAKMSELVLVEWLGEGSLASYRQNLLNVLANVKLKSDPADLAEGGPKWTSLVEQKMYPYEVAELMTDYLMSIAGKPAVVKYFAFIRDTGSRDAAFRRAFGMSHDEFIGKYKAYIAQEEKGAGQARFETEGDVPPEIVQRITGDGKRIEQKLRSQRWNLSMSQRFIIVPNQEAMLKVLRREQPQVEEARHVQLAQRSSIVTIGGLNYVIDASKLTDPPKSFNDLASIMGRWAIELTARPASVTAVSWLYEGGSRLLVAKLADEAGFRSAEDVRQYWIKTLKNARAYPTLTEIKGSLPTAISRYGAEVVTATAYLATAYLISAPSILADYYVVLRDINDGPRTFQQVFAKSLDGYDTEFSAYLKTLLQ
jgi:hypothetical protein